MTSPFVCSPSGPRAGPPGPLSFGPTGLSTLSRGLGSPMGAGPRHQELAEPSHAVNRTALGPGAVGPKVGDGRPGRMRLWEEAQGGVLGGPADPQGRARRSEA